MSELALLGGDPIRKQPYPAWPISFPEDRDALEKVLQSGRWGGNYAGEEGFIADEFAKEFAQFHDAAFGVPCMNGTIALMIALAAAGIGYNDEVIVPATTFVATATAVLFVNALPVFVDVDPDTLCMSPSSVEAHITEKTKAVIPVHVGGIVADLDALGSICQDHGLVLIQDAAHAHGCQWDGKGIGAFGDMACFSFQSLKLITAGEGGMILTNSRRLMENCRVYTNVGRVQSDYKYAKPMVGSNLRMTEWQAAMLKSQFARYPDQMSQRSTNAKILDAGLAKIEGIRPILPSERQTRTSYYRYGFLYDKSAFGGIPRTTFVKAVKAEGIPLRSESGQPVYRSPLFPWRNSPLKDLYGSQLDYSNVHMPVSERTTTEEACRLSHEILLGTKQDMEDIIRAIEKVQYFADDLTDLVDTEEPEVITSG